MQTPLLITAQHSPKGSPIQLADLKSRLAWDHVYHLQTLDEKHSLQALQLRAQSRGFDLPDEVAAYLLKRVARDMHNLFQLLDKLDNASLVAKKKLSIPFVKTLLDWAKEKWIKKQRNIATENTENKSTNSVFSAHSVADHY